MVEELKINFQINFNDYVIKNANCVVLSLEQCQNLFEIFVYLVVNYKKRGSTGTNENYGKQFIVLFFAPTFYASSKTSWLLNQ